MKISLIDPKCEPYKAHKMDAGYDLRSNNENFKLLPGAKIKVHTGVKVAIPPRHAGMIFPRSGLGTKFDVRLANTVGIIDAEYRGEIVVWLVNNGNTEIEIKKYDRFCQLIIVNILIDNLRIVDELDKTTRGEGGFGHTGIQ